MLLEPKPKLEERIVELLARHPSASAAALQELISKTGKSCSIQAVYQELRKLRRSGIVLKSDEAYSLRLGWILELLDLTQSMYENYLQQASPYDLLPSEGEKVSWKFYDLHKLVTFSTQLGLVLFKENSGQTMYEYAPHIWYHLAHGQNEQQFVNALRLGGFRYYAVIRGDTYLDRSYEKYFNNLDGELYFGRPMFGKNLENAYLYVIGDFVCTLRLQKSLSEKIEELYGSTHCAEDLSVARVTDVFHTRSRINFTVINDARKAGRLKKKFKTFLGV